VGAAFDTAGAVVGAAAVQAWSNDASAAPPKSNALRRISARRSAPTANRASVD